MEETNQVHIACAIDEGFVRPLCGMLGSLFLHHRETPLRLHILTGVLSNSAHKALEKFLHRHHADFCLYKIPDDKFSDYRLALAHFSKATFYRLLIPEMVVGTDRVLYLDVDVLVRRNLSGLFARNLGGMPIGAISDAYPEGACQRLGLPLSCGYFNSGVLLMDLSAWRQDEIAKGTMAYLERNREDLTKCRYADQDGLNVFLQGRWKNLEEIWNFNLYHCSLDPASLPEPLRAALREGPAIVHFADARKPWMRQHAMPFQRGFLENARQHGIRFPLRLRWGLGRSWLRERLELKRLQAHYRSTGILHNDCF